jgi:hypothetical protein
MIRMSLLTGLEDSNVLVWDCCVGAHSTCLLDHPIFMDLYSCPNPVPASIVVMRREHPPRDMYISTKPSNEKTITNE